MPGLSEKTFQLLKKSPLKFVATVGEDGYPNLVPILSLTAWDKDTLCFVRFMVWKTRKNLEERKKVAVGTMGLFRTVEVLGEFVGFEKSGEKLEFFNTQPIYRYNAYFGAGQVGVIQVKEEAGSYPSRLWRGIQARLFAPSFNHHSSAVKPVMPKPVFEKFSRILAVKFLSWIDEQGFPRTMPAMGAFPLSPDKIAVLGNLDFFRSHSSGKKLSLAVLFTEPGAYQVKGKFVGIESRGISDYAVVELEQSFSASPPLPGKRIYPAE